MSDGFVIYLETEDEEAKKTFWSGEREVESLESSHVYLTRSEAKRLSGEIQSRYTQHTVGVTPVTVTIALKPVVTSQ